MIVQDWMSKQVEVVGPEDRIATVREKLRSRRVRQFPVLSGGCLIGIITDRDLRGQLDPNAKVAAVMTPAPVTTTRYTPVEKAAAVLRAWKIGALPVVEGEELVGIVSESDLLAALVELCEQLQPTTEIELLSNDGDAALERMRVVVERNYGHILHLSRVAEANGQQFVTLWVRMPVGHVPEQVLEEAGFRVLSCISGRAVAVPETAGQNDPAGDLGSKGTRSSPRP